MHLLPIPGAPIWVELYTSDPAGAKVFYGWLFGWTAEESGPEHGGYLTFQHEGGPVAGCMRKTTPRNRSERALRAEVSRFRGDPGDGTSGEPNGWSVYLESKDAAETAGMAEANGGRVVVAPMPVDDLGHMAVITDPAGATVGIWQPGTHHGIAAHDVVGAPVWFELLTTRYDDSVRFYENVFGWATSARSDTDEFRYTTLGKDDDAVAGIMDASAFLGDAPPTWSMYVQVADADETARQAEEAGGAIVMTPEDTSEGRIAELADPAGARFKILGPNLESA